MAGQAGLKDFQTELAASEDSLAARRERPAGGNIAPVPGGELSQSAPRAAGSDRSYGVLVLAIFAVYMGLATLLYVIRGDSFITPDRWAVFLFVGAVVLGQGVAFVRDWIPFVLLVFGYEYMRGLAGDMIGANTGNINVQAQHTNVHVVSLLNADRALFGGHDPTLWIQHKLYTPGTVHWYDVLAALWYLLHFVLPCVFAFTLWVRHKDRFWRFTVAFLVMTYAAFGFFLFFPSAPPWLANNWGYLHGIQFTFNQAWSHLLGSGGWGGNFQAIDLWTKHSGNPVAAFPSLHAAFPWLVTLYAVKFYGKWGALLFFYNPILWFSVVYSGNHWVIDVLAGIAWATLSFVVVEWAWPRIVEGVRIPWPRPVLTAAHGVQTGWAFVTWPYRRARAAVGAAVMAPFRSSDAPER